MTTSRIIQTAAILLGPVLITGCAASNQYVSKLFGPRPDIVKDTQQVAKFLDLDETKETDVWVTASIRTDSTLSKDSAAIFAPIVKQTKPVPAEPLPPAIKKTTVPKETMAKNSKAVPIPEEPAKTENGDGTRTKKSRE